VCTKRLETAHVRSAPGGDLAADLAARKSAGAQLLHSGRIKASAAGTAQLQAGQVRADTAVHADAERWGHRHGQDRGERARCTEPDREPVHLAGGHWNLSD